MTNDTMPGYMGESPHKGEPSSNTNNADLHVGATPAVDVEGTEPSSQVVTPVSKKRKLKPTSTPVLAENWTKGAVKLGKLRSQSQGEPWIPPGALKRSASEEQRKVSLKSLKKGSDVSKGLDRPETGGGRHKPDLDRPDLKFGGDRSEKNLDRPADTGGDRLDKGGTSSKLPLGKPEADRINNDEANPLVVSPSISALGIESDLLGLGEPQEETELPRTKKKGSRKPIPDADGWNLSTYKNGYRSGSERKENISGAKTFTQWDDDGLGGDDPVDENEPEEGVVSRPEPKSPTVSSKSRLKKTPTKRTKRKSSGGREFLTPGKGSESEREESDSEMVPVDEPTQNNDPEPEGIVMFRKFFGGDGNWTERDMRTMIRNAWSIQNARHMETEGFTRERAIEAIRKNNIDYIRMPPRPITPEISDYESEHLTDHATAKEATIRVSSVSANDADSDGSYYKPKKYSDHWNSHNRAINKLSAISASTRPKITDSRPMEDVRINYQRDPRMPDGLAGSTSMMLVGQREADKKGKGRARYDDYQTAPSISTPAARHPPKSAHTVRIADNGSESDRATRRTDQNRDRSKGNRRGGTSRGNGKGSDSGSDDSPSPNNSRRPNGSNAPNLVNRKTDD
jgi:hypothetical protein